MRQSKRTHQHRRQIDKKGITNNLPAEWIGGRVVTSSFITEGEPHRVELNLWIELPDELIVGMEVIDPKRPTSFGDSLLHAMQRPAMGTPRRPAKIRVEDAALAAELRSTAPEIEVVVAPTPELAEIAEQLFSLMPKDDEEASYFEDGRVSAATVESLFRAAAGLYRLAPWRVTHDGQVLRFDIPGLAVEGACVSIIGALGESFGILIFPSLAGYEALAQRTNAPMHGKIDLGTTILALSFEAAGDLPSSMRREAAKHGWPVVDVFAYPRVEHRDRDGVPRPLTERDVQIATACAGALSGFFARHRAVFEGDFPDPISESYTDDIGRTVRITAPYEAYDMFEPGGISCEPYERPMPKVSRNETCPCGSGLKYKKCCLDKDALRPRPESGAASINAMDDRQVADMLRFTKRRYNDAWELAAEDFDDAEATMQLSVPWLLYCFLYKGRTIVDRYLEERGRSLAPSERDWLTAQQRSWLTVWEVLDVEPGKLLIVKDLLSGEERSVHEVSGSRTLKKRDAVLARVVDHAGVSLFCGCYPRSLPPMNAAEVVRRTRARLRKKSAIPIERLRDESLGRYLIARWEEAVEELDAQRALPLRLHNTDGDLLLLTTDHFSFEKGQRSKIEQRLRAMEDVQPPHAPEKPFTFLRPGNAMHKDWDTTIIGSAFLSEGDLTLETNSLERADALRKRIENAFDGLVSHRRRERSDPLSQRAPNEQDAARDLPVPAAEADQIVREFKARHYESWIDQPLPALAGMTPRQAARKKALRGHVDVLLKDIENHENRLPGGPQVDFSGIRAQLGLD